MRRVIDAAPEGLRLMLIFAASTGVGEGEQWAARWRDLDLAKHELRISHRVDVYGEESAPKSIAGVRTVPLSDQLMAMLKTWRLRSQFSKMDDLIFPNRNGRYVGHDNLIKRQFLPLFDELKLNRFNWHGLRHFAVSCWIETGLAAKTVRTFAGHASLQVTMDSYDAGRAVRGHKRRWTRSPRGSSHDRGTLGEQPSPACAIHVTCMRRCGTAQDGNVDFIGIHQHRAGRGILSIWRMQKARCRPSGLFSWLRGSDLNLRPSGYEPEGHFRTASMA